MGLLDTNLNDMKKSPRRSDKIMKGEEMNMRGLLDAATNIPVAGDALSGGMALYDLAKGDYGSAAANALGVLPFVSAGMVKGVGKAADAVSGAKKMTEYELRHEIARKNAVEMLGLPENNTAMDRARALEARPAYHGTTADVPQFDLRYYGSDGVPYKEPAIFSSPDTFLASDYAINKFDREISDAMRNLEATKRSNPGVYDDSYESARKGVSDAFAKVNSEGRPETGGGANVMPLMILGDHMKVDANGQRFMQAIPQNLDAAKAGRFDGVEFSNVIDNASPASDYATTVYATLNPSRIRSRFAAFDPARINEADIMGYADPTLLGGIAGGGLLGLGAYKAYNE